MYVLKVGLVYVCVEGGAGVCMYSEGGTSVCMY